MNRIKFKEDIFKLERLDNEICQINVCGINIDIAVNKWYYIISGVMTGEYVFASVVPLENEK